MKKKQIFRLLTVLLCGSVLFASCISEPSADKYLMTVNVTKSEDVKTRALWIDHVGETNELKAKWAAGEKVIVYDYGEKVGELTAAASETASTVLSGELESAPSENSALIFFLHSDTFDYTGQDGTLATIGSKFDYGIGMSQDYTVSGNTISVANGISLRSTQAIIKFTLVEKADGTPPIKPTRFVIHDDDELLCQQVYPIVLLTPINLGQLGPGIVLGDLTLDCSGTTNEVYVSLLFFDVFNMVTELPTHTLTLTADDGTSTYTYTKTDVTFLPGNYYEITVKMTKQ